MSRASPFNSLRYRFTGIMLTTSLAFCLAAVTISTLNARAALEENTLVATHRVLEAHVAALADELLVDDRMQMRRYAGRLVQTNPTWLAVVVTDSQAKVLAAANSGTTELRPEEIRHLPSGSRLQVGDEPALVEHLPLLGPDVGTVSVVVSLAEQHAAAWRQAVRLGIAMLALLVTGVAAALILGHWLTKPLMEMAVHVRQLGRGQLGQTIPVPSPEDELAILARAVNQMSTDLETAVNKLEKQQRQFIGAEKLAAVGTLAAGVAHEVANPIAGVSSCVRRLARNDLPPDKRERYVRAALDGLQRASKVLSDLLIFAHADSGELEEVRLTEVAEDVAVLVGLGTPITLEVQGGVDLVASWPREQVGQVLTNLLLNAAQAARSRVVVRWTLCDDEFVVVEIIDDGPGIPEDLRESIFEPFVSTRDAGEGTGLGLSVSQSIVDALHGRLELVSREDGSGTTASLYLPLQPEGPDAA